VDQIIRHGLAGDGVLGFSEHKNFTAADSIRNRNAPENSFAFVKRLRHGATIKRKERPLERNLTSGERGKKVECEAGLTTLKRRD
jgi:hypothetical protein